MSISKDLIRSITDEDFVSAKELTYELLFSTASDHIDDVRRDVAQEVFEGCENCDEELDEMADYDKDGVVEKPKDEVLGSRINAAVKSGKMTPAQAAKTKNKGKYR